MTDKVNIDRYFKKLDDLENDLERLKDKVATGLQKEVSDLSVKVSETKTQLRDIIEEKVNQQKKDIVYIIDANKVGYEKIDKRVLVLETKLSDFENRIQKAELVVNILKWIGGVVGGGILAYFGSKLGISM
jgi:predicted  nucleic acid-binding Zn-ribbon protein